MTRRIDTLFRRADRDACRIGHRARRRAAAVRRAGLHRRAGHRGPCGVSGELRQLPRCRPRRSQRSAAARGRRLPEHVAHAHHEGSLRLHVGDDAARRTVAADADQYASIVAYVLQQNSAAAGATGVRAGDGRCRLARSQPVSVRPAAQQAAAGARGAGAGGGRGQGGGRGAGGGDDGDGTAAVAVADAAGRCAAPRGVTVAGEVKNYVPVTDAMLRNPPAATG